MPIVPKIAQIQVDVADLSRSDVVGELSDALLQLVPSSIRVSDSNNEPGYKNYRKIILSLPLLGENIEFSITARTSGDYPINLSWGIYGADLAISDSYELALVDLSTIGNVLILTPPGEKSVVLLLYKLLDAINQKTYLGYYFTTVSDIKTMTTIPPSYLWMDLEDGNTLKLSFSSFQPNTSQKNEKQAYLLYPTGIAASASLLSISGTYLYLPKILWGDHYVPYTLYSVNSNGSQLVKTEFGQKVRIDALEFQSAGVVQVWLEDGTVDTGSG